MAAPSSFFRLALGAVAALALAGCSTVGQGFDPTGVGALVPGHTTLAEANVLLKAPPSATYAAVNGSFQALWYAGLRGPVDAHASRSALLAFGADGRFRRVVEVKGMFVDEAAAVRQREQLACLEGGRSWPCTGPAAREAVFVPVPIPAAPAPTGCYAAGDKVTVCPTL